MRPIAPLINVLGLLLWWCLTGLGARLARGVSVIAKVSGRLRHETEKE